MGFAVGHVDFVHKNKKEDTQSAKVKVKLWIVDLKGHHQYRTDKTKCDHENDPFGISEAKNDRKCTATVFSVTLPVFDVFDDFSDQVDKKGENGVCQYQEFGLLIIIADHPDGCPGQ